jgi:hypothetical protein
MDMQKQRNKGNWSCVLNLLHVHYVPGTLLAVCWDMNEMIRVPRRVTCVGGRQTHKRWFHPHMESQT